ncbi:hypothetical protein BJX70DRAFT_394235 [Aspergillus crustosus]
MGSDPQAILKDLIRLTEEVRGITSLPSVKSIGIKIRCVKKPPSSSPHRRINFKPCYYRPPKPMPKTKNKSKQSSSLNRKCPRRLSRVVSSRPLSSSSTLRIPPSSSSSSSECSLERPSSSLSSLSFSTSNNQVLENGTQLVSYPPVLEQLALTNKHIMPPLPEMARPSMFKDNGLMTKAKRHEDSTLDLHEIEKWEITQVLEDTSYAHPHTIVEIFVNPTGPADGSILTMSEVRAILRVLRLRVEMNQYQIHTCFPVLAISYIASKHGDNTDCRSGRIVQAHHDGRHLVIQYTKRFDFINEKKASAALNTFLHYYLCEPIKTMTANSREGGSWRWLSKWSVRKKARRVDISTNGEGLGSESREDLPLWGWFTKKLTM